MSDPSRAVRTARAAALALGCGLLVSACLSEVGGGLGLRGRRGPHTPLERGLAAIRPALIAEDVAFLAADELEGRDTPSRGLRIAARYIVHRLQTLGLHPGAQDGWFHEWVLVQRQLTAERTSATLTLAGETLELTYGEDYGVHPTELRDGTLDAALVWCGDGSRSAFRGLELEGRIAVCLEGSESRARRRHRAADAGAVGVLVVVEPDSDEAGTERFAEWGARTARSTHHWPRAATERLPVFWLDGEAAARFADHAGEMEPGAALDGHFTASVEASRDVAIENVCAFWPGSDPLLRDEVILVSAHYDHVGTRGNEIYNGADDNASGSSALMALAEGLVAHGPLPRSVMLLWVSGEEKGLFGSKAWALSPWLPGDAAPICNINFDMVGRNPPGMLEYTPTEEHPEHNGLAERMVSLAPVEGFDDLHNADKDFRRSDHASFATHLGIPVLYVSAGEHEDYHKPTDTADKIDADKVARFTRLVLRLLDELQTPELGLVLESQAQLAAQADAEVGGTVEAASD